MCQRHPASTAMQTQPLSNRVLLVCAHQKVRRRNIGVAKKTWEGFWRQRKAVWKDLFSNISTMCIYPNNSWTIRRMCQSTKHCLSQMLPIIFILLLRRNIPWTTMISIVLRFGKRALERNASIFILWTWGRMLLKGIFLSNFWSLYML